MPVVLELPEPGAGISSRPLGPGSGTLQREAGEGGVTHGIHLPGQLLSFRWPVPPPRCLSDSTFLLLGVLSSPAVGKARTGQGSCELWPDPSWADLKCWELSLLPSLCLLTRQRPLLHLTRCWRWAGPGGSRRGACMPAGVCLCMCICVRACTRACLCV